MRAGIYRHTRPNQPDPKFHKKQPSFAYTRIEEGEEPLALYRLDFWVQGGKPKDLIRELNRIIKLWEE